MSNKTRIRDVLKVVKGYAGEDHDLKANIIDVLTDLRHLCRAKKMDFEDLNRVAGNHYDVEKKYI